MGSYIINCCSLEHIQEYGEIYAKAFSGEPWKDCWKIEDVVRCCFIMEEFLRLMTLQFCRITREKALQQNYWDAALRR